MLSIKKKDGRPVEFKVTNSIPWKKGILYGIVDGIIEDDVRGTMPLSHYLIEDEKGTVTIYRVDNHSLRFPKE